MKKAGIIAFTIFLGVAIWYLFIKQYDYQVSFKVKGSQGSVYYQIVNWESWGEDPKIKNINTVDSALYERVIQQVITKSGILNLEWNVESINDSITQIKVGAISEKKSVINRLAILTGETTFTRLLNNELIDFGKEVNKFARSFRIRIEGESEIPELEYLYISSKSNRLRKAAMMLPMNADLYPKILENKVETNGYPFVKITEWDIINDDIKFNFGFPVRHKDSLPISSVIKYGKSPAMKAIKATFYGNYRDSDQAWFALLEYAKRRNISVEKKPLEIFYNDPKQDGNSAEWKAEVFLPIK